jgi:hypothetical protein
MTDSDPPDDHEWPYYRREILSKLDHLEKQNEGQNQAIGEMRTSIAVLGTKVTLYAAAVAMLVSAIAEVASKVIWK